ncbi:TPA: hypothetical protein PXQ47_003211, partial [Yersinia enterocolitica]|nr:hypothetical protein [Yersinia enterocolitica]
YLAISEIPKVIIDSEFSWGSAVVTILGALIAGGIPALIAWISITNSQKTVKTQLLISHRFDTLNKVSRLSAEFAASMEALGAFVVFKQFCQNDSMTDINQVDIKNLFFTDAVKINLIANELTLLLDIDIPITANIVKSIHEIQLKIREQTDKRTNPVNNNIDGFPDVLDTFIKHTQSYLGYELKRIESIKNS